MPAQRASALDLISDAMVEIGALASGETPTAADAALGLRRLNGLVDAWAAERLTMGAAVAQAFPLVGGQAWYTLGPGGDFDTVRPAFLEAASVVLPGAAVVEQPLTIYTDLEWQTADKWLSTGTPTAVYNNGGDPLLRLQFLGTPTGDGLQTILYLPIALDAFADLSTIYSLPPALYEALLYNLALRLSEPFTRPLSGSVVLQAGKSLGRLKRLHVPRRELEVDRALLGAGGGPRDIRTDR